MREMFLGCVVFLAASAGAEPPLTVVESTGYLRTSMYAEVVTFVHEVASTSQVVSLATLTTSTEGRPVPLVILAREQVRTPAELRAAGKPAMLIMANIHAGEVEGKEACQMLIRDVAGGTLAHLLDHQVVLVIPIFNPDGNDKLGDNRGDNGPELAGVRHNGQNLDLNRDYTKLESPEVRALVDLFTDWDPVLVVDMHTTNGSYHQEPVTYTTGINPNGAHALGDHMWQKLFPQVAERLRSAGWQSLPYGNFLDREAPEKGWESDTAEIRYGTNYVALRNRLAILDEGYAHADFKTRVLSSFAFITAILEYTNNHAAEIEALVRSSDSETRDSFMKAEFATAWKLEPLMDVTIASYEFSKQTLTQEENERYPWAQGFRMVPTEVHRDYTAPYLARAVPTATILLPAGYVVLPGCGEAVDNLLAHGLAVERLLEPAKVSAQHFAISEVTLADRLYQGHVAVTVGGSWGEAEPQEVPAGAVFVSLSQPLARLIPVLLEPASTDSLAAWGFFNRLVVRQWSAAPGTYPVLRVATRPTVPMVVVDRP